VRILAKPCYMCVQLYDLRSLYTAISAFCTTHTLHLGQEPDLVELAHDKKVVAITKPKTVGFCYHTNTHE
jgi:hypothetical protein